MGLIPAKPGKSDLHLPPFVLHLTAGRYQMTLLIVEYLQSKLKLKPLHPSGKGRRGLLNGTTLIALLRAARSN